jgi:hypothetical protein
LLELVANTGSSRVGRVYAYCLAIQKNILWAISSTVACSMQIKDTEAQNTIKCKNWKPLHHKNEKAQNTIKCKNLKPLHHNNEKDCILLINFTGIILKFVKIAF